jgi:DNA-directed RNA polymerase subunit RPC12/RpoP
MGIYEIACVICKQGFLWFSGTTDQRCEECRKENVKEETRASEVEGSDSLSFDLQSETTGIRCDE